MNLPISPEMFAKAGYAVGGAAIAAIIMLSLSGQPFSSLKIGLAGLEATFQNDEITQLNLNYAFCKAELDGLKNK